MEEFGGRNKKLSREQEKVGRIAAITNPLTFALVSVAAIALVWVGSLRVDGGAILQGDVVALYSYLSLILVELVKLANLIFTVSKAISCEKRIEQVLNAEGEPSVLAPPAEKKGDAAFSFENVSFAYAKGARPRCITSRSPPPAAKWWAFWAARVRARRRSSTFCPASIPQAAAWCASAATT